MRITNLLPTTKGHPSCVPLKPGPSILLTLVVMAAVFPGPAGCAQGGRRSSTNRDSRIETPTDRQTAHSKRGMVVSVSGPASDVGREVLRAGGNAVDAAVATAFALAVTFPEAGNIGGGGFMLIHPGAARERVAGRGPAEPVVIDYRETAPAAATADMFAGAGRPSSHLLVGVPGTVRGLALAHARFGRLPWKRLVDPAVFFARDGFDIDADLARALNEALADAASFPEFRRVFGKPAPGGASTTPASAPAQRRTSGRASPPSTSLTSTTAPPSPPTWQPGDRLVQADLARTLALIADGGESAFYTGAVAAQTVATVREGGGILAESDLAAYEAKFRRPVHTTYRGHDVYAPPPPSSGGVALAQMLNILETFDLRRHGRTSPRTIHLMAEAMRLAYFDRARHLGDADFVQVPAALATKNYAAQLAASIDPDRATPSESLAAAAGIPIAPTPGESEHTTHFSVVDAAGMAVSNTYTLEQSFGGRVVVTGHGFLLNNEMGDFSPRPGHTDRTGRIGTPPNVAAPGKRMLSSMTPTIVAKDGRVVLVTGSPGGRTIINTVLCVVLNFLEFGLSPRDAIDAARLHHPWLPDRLQVESRKPGPEPDFIAPLRTRGHVVEVKPRQGDAHSIFVAPDGRQTGVADRRRSGAAAGG